MSDSKVFVFDSYRFDAATKTAHFTYGYDESLRFTETYTFDFDFVDYDQATLDRALQLLFFTAGVSYYKMYLAPTVSIHAGSIDQPLADFLNQTYRQGLGEFCYVNQLPLLGDMFTATSDNLEATPRSSANGALIGLGGGKDSLVSVELLRNQPDISTWSVGHKPQLSPLVERIGLPHYWVERSWDRTMLDHNQTGAYNGHVPISAILAAAGTVASILSGKRDIVVSNEQSANEPTLQYQGVAINHQYSKSQAFERSFQELLNHSFGDTVRYYSLLRPLSELRIAELFTKASFATYHDVFSSCNRAFTHDSQGMFWDGTCPKCAFVFLALTPFVPRTDLEQLFSGKNLLLDATLNETYRNLLGIEGEKPLECVGEIKESRAAMRLAQDIYPELAQYQFDIPESYNYKALASHCMPPKMYKLVQSAFAA